MLVQIRANGESKRVTVGWHRDVAPDQARKDAAKLIVYIKAGLPPVETEPKAEATVADLADHDGDGVVCECMHRQDALTATKSLLRGK